MAARKKEEQAPAPDSKYFNAYVNVLKARFDNLINECLQKDATIVVQKERIQELEQQLEQQGKSDK